MKSSKYRVFVQDVEPFGFSGLVDITAPDLGTAITTAEQKYSRWTGPGLLLIPHTARHAWPHPTTGRVSPRTVHTYGLNTPKGAPLVIEK